MSANAIEAKGLVKNYVTWERRGFFKRKKKMVKALKGVSFNVLKGEIFGLLGPNGAGKTTTVKIITTLLIPDEGEATVLGYDIIDESEKVREVIGVTLSVEKGFFWKLTGRENLKYFGMLRGLRGRKLDERIEEVLGLVGLKELGAADKLYEEYSLGMKARLALARALLHNPPVLILDEPTIGLDPMSARTIRELLVKLAREEEKTVLITTHNMFEAELICDHVAIINEGRIIAYGTIGELKRRAADRLAIEMVIAAPHSILGDLEARISKLIGVRELALEPFEEGRAKLRIVVKPGEEEPIIAKSIDAFYSNGIKVYQVKVHEPTLEDVFILLTRESNKVGSDAIN